MKTLLETLSLNIYVIPSGQFGNIFTGQMLYGDGTSIKVTIKKAASFNTQRIIFTREMDTLARLMYPNIALLHGLIPDGKNQGCR